MKNFRNYYEILDVESTATGEAIKQAFRRLARRYHPDLNPGDKTAEDKFKDINEAYEILSDEVKRAQYDQFARFWQQNGFARKAAARKAARNGNGVDYGEYRDFNSFVEQLLNREPSARVDARAPDAYRPGTTKTAYTVEARPRSSGKRPGAAAVREREAVPPREPRPTPRPPEPKRERPRDVEARLSLPLEKAYKGGHERIRLEDGRSLEVEMPPGTLAGQKIRLKGQGLHGGDLYLKIMIEPHGYFELQGADIFCRVPLTPSEAVLGGPIPVPTLDGPVKMNVPPGVRSGQRLRLANKGYPRGQSRRGDQLVELQVVIPTEITPAERELYEQLRACESFNPRQELLPELGD